MSHDARRGRKEGRKEGESSQGEYESLVNAERGRGEEAISSRYIHPRFATVLFSLSTRRLQGRVVENFVDRIGFILRDKLVGPSRG